MNNPAEYSYKITRELDAPVDKVWQVWTEASDYEQWAYAVPGSVELNVQPGGSWKATMQTPDGNQFPLTGTYSEVVTNQKLVMTMDIPGSAPEVMVLELAPSDSGTTVTLSQACETAEARDQAEEGSGMLLDSCTAYLAKI